MAQWGGTAACLRRGPVPWFGASLSLWRGDDAGRAGCDCWTQGEHAPQRFHGDQHALMGGQRRGTVAPQAHRDSVVWVPLVPEGVEAAEPRVSLNDRQSVLGE